MAENFGLKIGLEGEKEFKKALAEINQEFKVLGSEMKLVDSQFEKNDKSVEALTSRNQVLTKEIEAQKSKIETLKSALDNASTSFGENDKRTQNWQIQLNNAQAALNDMERELEENNAALKESEEGFDKAGDEADEFGDKVDDAGKDADSSKGKFEALGTVCKAVAAALAAAAGAVVGFAKDSLETGMEFDTAMSQVAATMGTTVDQVEELRDKAKEMGASTKYTATEAAEGLNILAMAGLSADESISGIETVLNLASAGAMDLSSSASYLTGVVKGFGDSMDNAQYYADLMAKGATLAATDVQGLGEAFSEGAATAASFNQDAESMTVALLRLAEQNSTGSEAANALNRAMYDLYTPTDSAKKALDELGISAYDASGNARDINDVVDELNKSLSQMSQEERNNYADTIFSTRGLQAFNKMCVSTDEKVQSFKDGLAGASDEFGGIGAAAGQAQTQLDNLQGDLTILDSALDGLKIEISDQLTPTMRTFAQFTSNSLGSITTAFREGGLDGAMAALGQSLSDGLAMITEMLPSVMNAAGQLLGTFVQGVIDNLPLIVETGLQIIVTLANGIGDSLPTLVPTIVETIITIATILLNNMDQILAAAMAIIEGLAEGLLNALPLLIEKLPEIITSIINFITNNLPLIVQLGMNLIIQFGVGLIKALPQLIAKIPQIVVAIINGLGQAVSSVVQIGKNIVIGLWNGIASLAGWIGNMVSNFMNSIVSGAKRLLGINSPSKVFAGIGENMGLGLGEGFTDVMKKVDGEMQDAIPTDFDVEANANVNGMGEGGFATVNLTQPLVINGTTLTKIISQIQWSNNQVMVRNLGTA